MQKVLYLMTVVLIISVANAGTSYKHQRSKRNDMNQCLDNPCQNGGTFTNNDGCFTCTCTDGWTGERCNKDMNQCMDNPCQNGGTFTNNDGRFTCKCTNRWTGIRCNLAVSNLALNKPAKQSSTHAWNGVTYSAKFAVDGNNGTHLYVDKCTHTAGGDTNPWWLVDLQAVFYIKSVRIFNRGMDEGGVDVSDRLRDIDVTVGLTELDINTACGVFAGPGTLSQLAVDIDCSSVPKGRFVKISKTTEYLTLCEVEVFGYSA